jgi:hypothetical protein
MDSSPAPSTELLNCVQHLRTVLASSIRVIDALIAVSLRAAPTDDLREEATLVPDSVKDAIPFMMEAIGASSHTLVRLSEAPGLHTRDCFSIARSVVELAVNICYIIAEGPPAAERALRHLRQKAYRDLERESKVGDSVIRLVYSGKPDPSAMDGLEEVIAEFTAKGGREKGWVELSIDDRIEAASKRLGGALNHKLHFARFMIYRHSSEVLHGTLFGVFYFYGATMPDDTARTPSKLMEHVGQQHMMVLFAASLALFAVVEAFHRAYGFRKAQEEADRLWATLHDNPHLKGEKDGPREEP